MHMFDSDKLNVDVVNTFSYLGDILNYTGSAEDTVI